MHLRPTIKIAFLGTLVSAMLIPISGSVAATIDSPGQTRLSGADRYATSAAISHDVFPTAESAFLTSGEGFADALSGGAAAATQNSPILLTPSGELSASAKNELQRLAPQRVFILGGQSVTADNVAAQAGEFGAEVIRLAGADRYATGVEISKKFWTASDVVYLASGSGFADALSGGALAAKDGAPLLLSGRSTLPAVVATELARLAPTKVVLLGGELSLSAAISGQIGQVLPDATVSRLAGADRFETSAAIAAAGWETSVRAMYATGQAFPDALAGVPAAAANDAPLLLTKPTCMPAAIAGASNRLGATVRILLGGDSVVANSATSTVCGSGSAARLIAAIGQLKVAAESNTGYDRDLFNHWIDADGDCQDTRDEVLAAESLVAVSDCNVTTGQWNSYYDREVWTASSDVDIDHVVALAEAWGSGARKWSADTRTRYANDLGDSRTLVAVTDNVNQSKSARDPSEWLPEFDKCRYVGEWTAIKLRWSLTVNSAEKSSLLDVANSCPNTYLTWKKAKVVAGPAPTTPPPSMPPPGMLKEVDILPPSPPDLDCSQIKYRNFLVRPGDPHRFDSDGDGIGCES